MDIRNKYLDPEPEVDVEGENKRLDEILKRTKFDLSSPPPKKSPVFFAHVGFSVYPIAYPGSLGLIVGAQKTRKTSLIKGVAAAALGNKKVINFRFDAGDFGNIACFDTEQRFHSFWSVQSQVHYLGGFDNNTPRYSAFSFIDETIEDRLRLIERYIETTEDVRMIVIDGALDVVEDFNSIKEAREVAERIARMANNSKAVVFVVVHASGKTGKFPTNSLGHLGSQLERKCDFALQLTYNDDTQFTEIRHLLSRGFGKFPSFEFTSNKEGYPVLDYNEVPDLVYPLSEDYARSAPSAPITPNKGEGYIEF